MKEKQLIIINMAITALGMAGIAGGQSLLNQGLGMLNQDRQAEKNK